MWKFIQYEFFGRWAALKKIFESRGIKLIGDMPIYVDADSSDFIITILFFNRQRGKPGRVLRACLPTIFRPTASFGEILFMTMKKWKATDLLGGNAVFPRLLSFLTV